MKKLLITICIILVTILTIITIIRGLQIGKLEVLGIAGMQEKNAELDETVTEATKLANSEFPSKVRELDASMKELNEQKTTYQDMVAVSSSEDVQNASQLTKYKIDYLWAQIGTHATSEGVIIKIDVTNGSGGENTYNLNFTANGTYINISEFIRDIEDDSTLGFKIEQFSMKAGTSTSDLQATFVCKNIPIEGISSIVSTTDNTNSTNETNTTADTNSTNSTNSTANTNSTNTTNQTNTTNTAQ